MIFSRYPQFTVMKKANFLKTFFLLIFILSVFFVQAQNTNTTKTKQDTAVISPALNKIAYLEIGGPGLAISVNYDTRFANTLSGWGYRLGIGFLPSNGNTAFTVPFQFNYLFGTKKNFFELGEGATYVNSRNTNHSNFFRFNNINGFVATATFGYRYQPAVKGLNFRIAFTPVFYDEGVVPLGGVSVGYTF